MSTESSRSVLIWSGAIALLVLLASIAGLLDPRVYAQETPNWALQGKGQDVGNLLAVVFLVASAMLWRHGSLRAGLVRLGSLLYLIYAYILYAMAVHLNELFLVYVAVLGLCVWAVIFHIGPLRRAGTHFPIGGARRLAAITLIVAGSLFALLWLREVVPAVITGVRPQSLVETGLWVNPVHVIDLSTVLPGFVISGIAALRGRAHGLFWVAPWLVFSVLMGVSILAVMAITATSAAAVLPPVIMVGIVVLVSAVAAWRYLSRTVSAE
ncbi:hypothetical protein [Raineyella fluvialis]|uniref:Uncharacterized protein n=1 Tax=Raineyella fluvialis TaxID=2662261 RepID=A0A5Q2F9Y8_9ACTN|nr:hypothetical protein [Raineyella fluvialis]QGF23790.1 hypothetical protein Rai3103_09005 [Raineyella fluvialis]